MTLENQQSTDQTQGNPSGTETQPEHHDPLDALVDEIEENLDDREGSIAGREPRQAQQDPPQNPDPGTEDPEQEPPQHWSEEHKQLFRSQTPEARKFLLERHKAMEGDYTQKSQTLAQQAQAVAGLHGLGARLQQDPQFREHMQSYFRQKAAGQSTDSNPSPDAGPANGVEDDPIAAIEERAANRAYERIKQEQKVQAQEAQQHEFEKAYNYAEQVKVNDPLSSRVMDRLRGYVAAQKHPVRIQETLRQLDTNPFFFNEMYRVLREEVVSDQPPEGGTDGQDPPANPPQHSRRTVAPNLERGGGAPVTTSQAKARKKRSEMKNAALRSGTTEALGEFLDSTGLIDTLL